MGIAAERVFDAAGSLKPHGLCNIAANFVVLHLTKDGKTLAATSLTDTNPRLSLPNSLAILVAPSDMTK